MAVHCQWRGCQEWRDLGVPLSTTSNEASKMFDAAVTQYLGWYEDKSMGGLAETIGNILKADPECIMGHVVKNGIKLIGLGKSALVDKSFADDIKLMVSLGEKSSIERERDHVRALKLWSEGSVLEACAVWEKILLDHPSDVLALKFAYHSYFNCGEVSQVRDTVARVLPRWTPNMPNYGYLHGMHAFGLEETNMFDKAEKEARRGLDINPRDGWSTHALCHVLEMMGRFDEGINFLTDTVKNWEDCGMIACHNFWHWALYYLERGDYKGALDLFDSEVKVRSGRSKAPWQIADAASLLFRLEMEGIDVGERWQDVYESCQPNIDNHYMAFHDVHFLLACLGTKKQEAVKYLMDSIKTYIKNVKSKTQTVLAEVGEPICEAFIAYNEGDYARAVDLFKPVRYKIQKMGASHAQHDIFNLFLIQAAIKSPQLDHHKLARSLLMERKALKECAPLTDRLMAKTMALHTD